MVPFDTDTAVVGSLASQSGGVYVNESLKHCRGMFYPTIERLRFNESEAFLCDQLTHL